MSSPQPPKGTFNITLPIGSGVVVLSGSLYPDEIAEAADDANLIASVLEAAAARIRQYPSQTAHVHDESCIDEAGDE